MSEDIREREARANEVEKQVVREELLRVLLTSEARQRLMNVKIVKPDVAKVVEDRIIQLASAGKLKRAITDEELKEILMSFQQPKKEFKIRWV